MLDIALPERNRAIVALTVDAVGNEWHELGEWFPAPTDSSVSRGLAERRRPRGAVAGLVLTLRRIDMASACGDFAAAAQAYIDYRRQAADAQATLKQTEPFSRFNPPVWAAHFGALGTLAALAR
ncbi:MAG: hypothetical protein P8Y53_00860 [Pseudolabrys sp.]